MEQSLERFNQEGDERQVTELFRFEFFEEQIETSIVFENIFQFSEKTIVVLDVSFVALHKSEKSSWPVRRRDDLPAECRRDSRADLQYDEIFSPRRSTHFRTENEFP